MAYFALVTQIQDVMKDPNSDNLYIGKCFNEGVIVSGDFKTGDKVLYLPTDGQIERWFGDKFNLFRKNEDGTAQGGYIENNGHIRAIKLRGNESSGVVIAYDKVIAIFGDQNWNIDDKVNEINGKIFCQKYISKRNHASTKKSSYKGRKAEGITYPEFSMHTDTEQLAYNLHKFQAGDKLNMTLKMHGTSQRSMNTYCELPNGFFRRLFHLKKRTKPVYALGTRRCVVTADSKGYYGNDKFRFQHHENLKPYIEPGMEVFYEVVGYYGPNETDTIMPIGDNKKINDKKFVKQFGPHSIFSYGCTPGESQMFIYRITSNNGEKEWSPEEITAWCNKHNINRVPVIEDFEFTTVEDLQNRINNYFQDLADPIGKTHVKEGVVIRIVNRLGFSAFKSKTYEFKVIEGIIKETETSPDMEEMEDLKEDNI